tara:strand:+ start:15215 stop:15499 length:285 start_codon:yes stop_codon:yes gene_type:complete
MLVADVLSVGLDEAKLIFGRKGTKVVKKYRCTYGRKKGRIVANPSVCGQPLDIKKRFILKKTKARFGKRMIRKAMRTKRFNPASRIIARMNRRR